METKIEYKVNMSLTPSNLATMPIGDAQLEERNLLHPMQKSNASSGIKTICALSAVALKNKLDAECKIAYLLRQLSINSGNCAAIRLSIVFVYLEEHGWSKSAISKTLKRGENIFWIRRQSKKKDKEFYIVLKSWADVLNYFNIPFSETYWNYRVLEDKFVPGRIGRAWLYASATAKYHMRMKYRIAIKEETGCSSQLQLIYEEIVGIDTEENFPNGGSDGDNPNKQLPNTFYTPLQKCRIRSLKDAAGKFVTTFKSAVTKQFYRRYFKSEVELAKYVVKNPGCKELKRTVFIKIVNPFDYAFSQQGLIHIVKRRMWRPLWLLPV